VKTKKLLSMIAILLLLLAALPVLSVGAGPAPKVDICHREGNGEFHLINVSENAYDAHMAHGDGVPGGEVPGTNGEYVFDDACNVVQALETTTVTSAVFNFSGTGWAGWSCPSTYPQVLSAYLQDAGTDGDPAVAPYTLYLWVPGATTGTVTYPNTPFGYTYGSGETGAIVQNGGTPQNARLVLTCQEAP
jgi:hypothetical protein